MIIRSSRLFFLAQIHSSIEFFCRHLLTVHPGSHLLSDALISSPILSADRSASIPEELGGSAPSAAGPSTSNNFEFGVDPSLDPELAMVLSIDLTIHQSDILIEIFV